MDNLDSLYEALPHGPQLYCIHSVDEVSEGRIACTALFPSQSMYECAPGIVSSSACIEAVAQAAALGTAMQHHCEDRKGGVIVKVQSCSCSVAFLKSDCRYRLVVEYEASVFDMVEVQGSVYEEAVCVATLSLMILQKGVV